VVFAQKLDVIVFSVFVFWLWKKNVAGCDVAGAATLGEWFGTRIMARARSVISTAFDPELPRIPESFGSHRLGWKRVPKHTVTKTRANR